VSIYCIVFLASVCGQFFNPALFALVGDIVPDPHRARASGLSQVTNSTASMIGPPLATFLVFSVGVQWALLFNALSFLVSFLTLLLVQSPPSATSVTPGRRGHFFLEFKAGIHFFLLNAALMAILVSLILTILGSSSLNVLNIFFVTQNLHTSANWYGFLGTAYGLGALVGAAVMGGGFTQRLGVTRTYWLSVLFVSATMFVYARVTIFPPALVVFFLIGLSNSAVNVALGPLLLRITPRELIGRVTSVLAPVLGLASTFSIAGTSFLASSVLQNFHVVWLGISFTTLDTIFTGGGILVLIGGLYAMVNLGRSTTDT